MSSSACVASIIYISMSSSYLQIASEERKQAPPLRIESANAKVRMSELAYLEKNNRYMAKHLALTGSMMPSKEELSVHNARNLKQKKLLSRKFFGALPNPNTHGETLQPITQEQIDAKPEWVGLGSQYSGGGSLDPVDPDDFALHEDDRSSPGGGRDRNSRLKSKARRRHPETPSCLLACQQMYCDAPQLCKASSKQASKVSHDTIDASTRGVTKQSHDVRLSKAPGRGAYKTSAHYSAAI
jgi:hypothetical protein